MYIIYNEIISTIFMKSLIKLVLKNIVLQLIFKKMMEKS